MSLTIAPPTSSIYLLSYPVQGVLIATLNRPKRMNSVTLEGHWELDALWRWFDNEPTLQVAIVTGAGGKAFCAGQDLLELEKNKQTPNTPLYQRGLPSSGFGGISQRKGTKPIIAAVNGYAFGGGFEMCLNW